MNKYQKDFNLYLITDRHQTLNRPLLQALEAALDGGVECVQLREKDLSVRAFLSLAFKVRELTLRKALFIVNDRIDVCLAVRADGVHLRSDSIPPSAARGILGEKKLIGVSCHSLEEVLFAEKEGADFVTLGPLFSTPSKRGLGNPMGLVLFQSIVSKVKIPVFALGGVRSEHIPGAIKAGAHGIALISAILASPDVRKEAERFVEKIRASKTGV